MSAMSRDNEEGQCKVVPKLRSHKFLIATTYLSNFIPINLT